MPFSPLCEHEKKINPFDESSLIVLAAVHVLISATGAISVKKENGRQGSGINLSKCPCEMCGIISVLPVKNM